MSHDSSVRLSIPSIVESSSVTQSSLNNPPAFRGLDSGISLCDLPNQGAVIEGILAAHATNMTRGRLEMNDSSHPRFKLVMQSITGDRFTPVPYNSPAPVKFGNEHFEGKHLVMISTGNSSLQNPYAEFLKQNKIEFVLQIQGRFKTQPCRNAHFGAEGPFRSNLSRIQVSVARAVGAAACAVGRSRGKMHLSVVTQRDDDRPSGCECTHAVFPIFTAADNLIVSEAGSEPELGIHVPLKREAIKRSGSGGKGSSLDGEHPHVIDTSKVYTFVFFSSVIDLFNCQFVRVPGMRTVDCSPYLVGQPCCISMYDIVKPGAQALAGVGANRRAAVDVENAYIKKTLSELDSCTQSFGSSSSSASMGSVSHHPSPLKRYFYCLMVQWIRRPDPEEALSLRATLMSSFPGRVDPQTGLAVSSPGGDPVDGLASHGLSLSQPNVQLQVAPIPKSSPSKTQMYFDCESICMSDLGLVGPDGRVERATSLDGRALAMTPEMSSPLPSRDASIHDGYGHGAGQTSYKSKKVHPFWRLLGFSHHPLRGGHCLVCLVPGRFSGKSRRRRKRRAELAAAAAAGAGTFGSSTTAFVSVAQLSTFSESPSHPETLLQRDGRTESVQSAPSIRLSEVEQVASLGDNDLKPLDSQRSNSSLGGDSESPESGSRR